MSVRILVGDARAMLATLPEKSVQCCVTSPPYYGLREYQTGAWEGGDPECAHRTTGSVADAKNPSGGAPNGEPSAHDAAILRGSCPCGAVRVDKQIGLEPSPDEYVAVLVTVFREVWRVLRDDGTLWLNIGDSYVRAQESNVPQTKNKQVAFPEHHKAGSSDGMTGRGDRPGSRTTANGLKPKDLVGIPWMLAFALRADGWYLRQEIIWHKLNPMPESVDDRPTRAHEQVFLMAKSPRYYYDAAAIAEPVAARPQRVRALAIAKEKGLTQAHLDAIVAAGCTDTGNAKITQDGAGKNTPDVMRLAAEAKLALGGYYREFLTSDTLARNRRSVWSIAAEPYSGAHFATFPTALIEPCILAGSPQGGGSARPVLRRRHDWTRRGSPRPRLHRDRTEPRVRRACAAAVDGRQPVVHGREGGRGE